MSDESPGAGRAFCEADHQHDIFMADSSNPHVGALEQLQELLKSVQKRLESTRVALQTKELERRELKEVEQAFGRKGIPSFAFEGILGELQVPLNRRRCT